MRALTGALLVVLAASACSKARPLQGDLTQPVSWEEDIAPLFAAQCSSCHSGAKPAGGYRTTSYLEALGPRGARVAVAGDASSTLLRTLAPATADAVHQPVSGAFQSARAWVVDGRLSFFRSEVHEGGILNPDDPEFHSNLVRERTGAPVAIHPADAAYARQQGAVIDAELHAGQRVGPFAVVGVPGKSPGEVAFHCPRRRVLIVGDAVIGNPPGKLSLLREKVLDDPARLRASVAALAELEVDVLLPGDGEPILRDAGSRLRELVATFPP